VQAKTTAAEPAPQISSAKAAVAAKVSPAKAETKSVTASVPKAAKTVSVKAAMSVKSSAPKSSVSVKAVETEAAVDKAPVEKAVVEKVGAEKPVKAKAVAAKTAAVQVVTSAPASAAPAPAVPASAAQAPAAPAALAAPAMAKVVALKPADKEVFQPDDYVVYPTHGVGRILKIEKQEISGIALELFVIEFDKDKMTLRVPLAKVRQVGMRRLSTPQKMKAALDTLKGRARVKRTMWSRRAQEYEAKINSGDPVSIAEVVRDLHRNAGQPDQSYSERQIYEAALDRLARELAAVERIDEDAATKRLEKLMKAA
jgi:CarD family transcriptional regulator